MYFVPSHTIEDALADCGVLADTVNMIVDGSNATQRIVAEVFNNNFTTCINMEFLEFDYSWKTYISLSVAEFRIRLQPGTKVNIWSFVQWKCDRIRLYEDPASVNFNVTQK